MFAVPLAVLIVILLLSPIGKFGFIFVQRLFTPSKTWFYENVWDIYSERVMKLLPDFIRYDEETWKEKRKNRDR